MEVSILTIGRDIIVKHGVGGPGERRQVQGQRLLGPQPVLQPAPTPQLQRGPHAPHQGEDVQPFQVPRRDLHTLFLNRKNKM